MFKRMLLALLPLVAGMPPSAVKPAAPPPMRLQVTTFQAYSHEAFTGYANFVTFIVGEPGYSFGAICSLATAETLFSDMNWTECDIRNGDPGVKLLFQISPGFSQVRLKKGWKSSDMYMWGVATQDTYWKEGNGGNVTAMWEGKYYSVNQPWDFEVNSITG